MRRFIVGIVCAVAVTASCVPAFAEDPKAGADAGHDAHGGTAHGPARYKVELHGPDGKPVEKQLDMANAADKDELIKALNEGRVGELAKDEKPDLFGFKRWDLGLWSIAIFVLLFLALAKFAWKPMLEGLQKREESIRSALEQAELTRREAMAQHEQLQAKMKESAGEVAAMMDEARRDAQALKDRMVADAKAEIQQERDRLHREMDTARDQALQEIWQQSVSLAAAMSAKAMRRSIGEGDHQRLLDESLAELKQAGKGFGKRKLSGAGGI